MSDFEARVTVTEGAPEGSAVGAWLNLGTTRGWFVQHNVSSGSASAAFTVEIRRALNGVILDSATINLSAAVLD